MTILVAILTVIFALGALSETDERGRWTYAAVTVIGMLLLIT